LSGHSKWANIKRKKEATDAQRGKIFTKLGRELAIAVKHGGDNPDANSNLRDAIAKAKANNMPNDTIERIIKKAAGALDSVNYEELVYEGYGPGGVAIIVEATTDNRNRTSSDIRHIFDKSGGSLGEAGCVMWMFDRKGVLVIVRDAVDIDEDDMLMIALEAGAEDLITQDDVYEIRTAPEDFAAVRDALEKQEIPFISAQLELIPRVTVSPDVETARKVLNLIEKLEDHDDVQNVYHNMEMPPELEESDEE